MKFADNPERKRILNQALSARTLSEIAIATRELDEWVHAHPDDLGIVDAFEQLAMMQEAAEEKEAERTRSAKEPFAARSAAI